LWRLCEVPMAKPGCQCPQVGAWREFSQKIAESADLEAPHAGGRVVIWALALLVVRFRRVLDKRAGRRQQHTVRAAQESASRDSRLPGEDRDRELMARRPFNSVAGPGTCYPRPSSRKRLSFLQ
jgi:hypothetical protein